jgi:cellulose synthase operon protein C
LQEVGFIENDAALTVAKDLISVLQKDVPSVLSEGADKEKVQYLIANLPQLSTEDVNLIVRAVGDKEFRRRALLARVEYLMTKQRWKDSYEAIQQASSQLQPEGELRSTLNLYQLKMWLHTGSYETLLTKMDQLYLSDRDKRHRFYFKARIADAKGRVEEAATRYEQALTLLMYDEEVVLAAARFFKKYKPKQEKAYNILLSGITYNPYSSELFKAYALESLDQGLYTYADQAQLTLQGLLPATEYSTFIEKLNRKRQEVEARVNNWQL